MKSIATLIAMGLVLSIPSANSQHLNVPSDKKIVVLGSSVASGWVTSYEKQYDFRNGYAYRLERYLADKDYTVINKGIPGDNTSDALARFDADVLPENPDFVLIGLSMSNEGLETKDPDSVSISFETGMKKIIDKCVQNGIKPVLGLCYANNNYTPEQYGYLKKMNIKMNSWGYPCINFLGALDDGSGHFPEGTTFDSNHPDDRGHEEFFLAIPPGLFQAIDNNQKVPQLVQQKSPISLGKNGNYGELYYFPSGLIHSFSFGFGFKACKSCELAEIIPGKSKITIGIDNDLCLMYEGINSSLKSRSMKAEDWHNLVITHIYMAALTRVYLDGEQIGQLKEQIEPAALVLGDKNTATAFKSLLIYRAVLNPDEIKASDDMLIHASLECYAPLDYGNLENFAQNDTKLSPDPTNVTELVNRSLSMIDAASLARNNELKVEHKKAIKMDPSLYQQYAGEYEIAENDYFTVEVESDRIYFIDRGQKAEILPESENVFFIQYPGEITFTFEKDENGKVKTLIANFNGYILESKRR